MASARKTVITLTVYNPIDSGPYTNFKDLEDVVYDLTEGDAVGDWTILSEETVEGEELTKGLIAIGNDGDFFDDLFEDDEGDDED